MSQFFTCNSVQFLKIGLKFPLLTARQNWNRLIPTAVCCLTGWQLQECKLESLLCSHLNSKRVHNALSHLSLVEPKFKLIHNESMMRFPCKLAFNFCPVAGWTSTDSVIKKDDLSHSQCSKTPLDLDFLLIEGLWWNHINSYNPCFYLLPPWRVPCHPRYSGFLKLQYFFSKQRCSGVTTGSRWKLVVIFARPRYRQSWLDQREGSSCMEEI